jgi:hypothetical protein
VQRQNISHPPPSYLHRLFQCGLALCRRQPLLQLFITYVSHKKQHEITETSHHDTHSTQSCVLHSALAQHSS